MKKCPVGNQLKEKIHGKERLSLKIGKTKRKRSLASSSVKLRYSERSERLENKKNEAENAP